MLDTLCRFCGRVLTLAVFSPFARWGRWLLLVPVLVLAAAGPHDEPSLQQSLDGTWLLAVAPDAGAAERFARFHETGAEDSGFRTIPVPSNWALHGFEEPLFIHASAAEGFYVRRFTPATRGFEVAPRVLLHFGGVWQSAEVWLNGIRLGRHDSGFTAFAFDVTTALKPGVENLLCVRVRQQDKFWRMDQNDDWSLPGIFRSVWLEYLPKPFHLDRIEVVTDFDDDFRNAELRIRALVARYEKGHPWHSLSEAVTVRAVLTDARENEIQRVDVPVRITGARTARDVPLTLRVISPAPWTAETPALYGLRVDLIVGGNVVHSRAERVGFREVSTAGGVLRINGQAVKLRGVCRHDLNPEVGRATRPEDWLADVRAMKAANINTVRTAHYPPAEGFLRLCDELGLYVINEVPYCLADEELADPSFVGEALTRVHETVARDRNRASVIIWALGNEDPLTDTHILCARALKGMDPTRPLLLPWRAEADLPPEIDLLAPHYWTAEEYDRLAASSGRPIVTTEYTHAVGPDDFGGLADRWHSLTRHPAGAGAMIWEWADQGLRRRVNGRVVHAPVRDLAKYPSRGGDLVLNRWLGPDEILDVHGVYGGDGIVDADLAPQRDYWETKAVYSPVQVMTEQVEWTPGQNHVAIRVRNAYDFTDLSTIRANWTLFGDAAVLATGEMKLSCPPHAEATVSISNLAPASPEVGRATHLHLTFFDPAGAEITRHSVRLGNLPRRADAKQGGGPRPKVNRTGATLTVEANGARYSFQPATGQLATADWAGVRVVQATDLAVWRPPTDSECRPLAARKVQQPWQTFLQGMPARASRFEVSEHDDTVRVASTTEYRADARNAVVVDTVYDVLPSGSLKLSFVARPEITDADALPEVGLEFRVGNEVRELAWLGLGPGDSLPNRRASALFGQWKRVLDGSVDSFRPRSGIEWLDLMLVNGAAVRVTGATGFRVIPGESGQQRLRVLSHQAGAWVKGGPPERSEWRLDLEKGRVFEGTFEFTPPATPLR